MIREQLESFVATAREQGAPVARFVEREVRAYLACGVLAHGFLRVHCDGCGHDRLVAFSCKGRGFCPSCGGRRMADTAAHLVERVLPEVPVRQWVLTLPYPLRYRCAWDAALTSQVLRAFLRALFADQRRRARQQFGVRGGLCGAVSFIQRFGSALNLTPHFHSLVLDGVYPGPAYRPGPFLPLAPPETEDVARVMAGTARRVMRLLEARGLERGDDALATDDPLRATLMAASVRSRIASGPEAGLPWRRLGDRVEPEAGTLEAQPRPAPPRCVREGGMSLHADVAVPGRDRRRLERLCRYVARPPLASERLEALPDGRLTYRLKSRWRDGTTHILMERHELLERLAPLIPPPRAHQVRYHGVLAPSAASRDRIVPACAQAGGVAVARCAGEPGRAVAAVSPSGPRPARPEAARQPVPESAPGGRPGRQAASAAPRGEPPQRGPGHPPAAPARRRRLAWSALLQRVFRVDVLECPRCGGRMRILAAIHQPAVARRILACLGLPARAPPLAPAPPLAFDTSEHVPEPTDFESFDQTPPGDWDVGA